MTRRYKHGAYCAICGEWQSPKDIEGHHIHKKAVWGENDDIVPLCEICHDRVEAEITKRENTILRENFKNINLDGYHYVKRLIQNERKRGRGSARNNEGKCRTDKIHYRKNGEGACA
jgi:hypothetical protein